MDFYDQLEAFKKTNRLGYQDLGALIGKSGDTFRKAVSRRSLSDLEKREILNSIEHGKNSEKPLKEYVSQIFGDNRIGAIDPIQIIIKKLEQLFNESQKERAAIAKASHVILENTDRILLDTKEIAEITSENNEILNNNKKAITDLSDFLNGRVSSKA